VFFSVPCLGLLCLAFGGAAFAQESADKYPSKPIRIIVTFPAGGPTDFVARAIAQSLQEAWGRGSWSTTGPGAGGNIGMNIVAKGAAGRLHAGAEQLRPDGHQPVRLFQLAV
jgi:tripartite-type tricarboxylate transporter receptor subunit TctC